VKKIYGLCRENRAMAFYARWQADLALACAFCALRWR